MSKKMRVVTNLSNQPNINKRMYSYSDNMKNNVQNSYTPSSKTSSKSTVQSSTYNGIKTSIDNGNSVSNNTITMNKGLNKVSKTAENELNHTNDFSNKMTGTSISSVRHGVKIFKNAQKVESGLYKASKSIKVTVSKGRSIKTGTVKSKMSYSELVKRYQQDKYGILFLKRKKTPYSELVDRYYYYSDKKKQLLLLMNYHKIQTRRILKSGKESLKNIRVTTGKNVKTVAVKKIESQKSNVVSRIAKSTTKKTYNLGKRTVKTSAYGMGNQLENMMSNSDDIGTQTLNMGIKTGRVTVKTIKHTPTVAKTTYKGVKTVAKAPIKTARGTVRTTKRVVKTVNRARRLGAKKTSKLMVKNFAKASKKGVSFVAKIILKSTRKLLLPVIISVIGLLAVSSVISAPVSAVSAMFGGFFSIFSSDKKSEVESDVNESEYLFEKVTSKRLDFIDKITNDIEKYKNDYDIVKIYNTMGGELSDGNESIESIVPSVSEMVEKIQGIFHTILLTEYELSPNQSELDKTFDKIWKHITIVTSTAQPTEYCNEKDSDGTYHANDDCVNKGEIKKHTTYTSDKCDSYKYKCLGHEITIVEDGKPIIKTEYCEDVSQCSNNEKALECKGYAICKGHKSIYVTIGTADMNELLAEFFTNEINELVDKDNLTTKEKNRLKELEDNYSFCLEYIDYLLGEDYNYGYVDGENTGNADVGDVVVNNGSDIGSQAVKYGLQFVGNKYVWGGNSLTKGVDCSGFTQQVYKKFGVTIPRNSRSQAKTGKLVSYSQIKTGDLVFYAKNGVVNHVAMYIGDGKIVHASNPNPYPKGGIKISNAKYKPIYCIRRVAE